MTMRARSGLLGNSVGGKPNSRQELFEDDHLMVMIHHWGDSFIGL